MGQANNYLPLAAMGILVLAYIAAFFFVPTGNRKVLAYIGAVLVVSVSTWVVFHLGQA